LAAQNSSAMLIGIGTDKWANSLAVRWPSGKAQAIEHVAADSLVTVYENPAQSPSHKPFVIEKPPLVIWCGGVDQYKANHWRPIQDMLAKGFAVATLDQPGFGESSGTEISRRTQISLSWIRT